jgi:hypothetical protein
VRIGFKDRPWAAQKAPEVIKKVVVDLRVCSTCGNDLVWSFERGLYCANCDRASKTS